MVCFLYMAAVSFVFMLLFSKNSFLYPINNGPDINMFYTMGKGIANGLVCYRDIFDQKGPFWYFVYSLAYLIDKDGFLGVFLIEIISFSVFLFFVYRMMKLYKVERFIYIAAPLLAFVTCGNFSFLQGGQVEELIYPLMAYMFFSLLRYFKTDYPTKPMPPLTLFFNGICSGLVFWSKFTLITLWFIFMAALFFIMIKERQIKQAFLSCLYFLAGTMVPTAPVLIYFAAVGELPLLFEVYLKMNLFGYSTVRAGAEETLGKALKNAKFGLKRISSSLVITALGILGFAAAKKDIFPIGAQSLFSRFSLPFFLQEFMRAVRALYTIPPRSLLSLPSERSFWAIYFPKFRGILRKRELAPL